ncbi:hypothetical protein GGX14DRAFT_150365 [Mycena pura]|uniref:Protein kinase domain-containing protein n=1 Tax=Mycena pura TaxID=153505 RepID=A0AAD6YB96_9AGAR|nr:hypothetical protein GGX14DRAFT_150365 [Mycena pura]
MPTNQHGITAELSNPEIFWRDNYEHILDCGYRLRPRYKPDWVPSWKTDRLKSAAEDRLRLAHVRGKVTNGWRCSDEVCVVLKRVDQDELRVLELLNTLPRVSQNRTVPLLEVIPLSEKSDESLAVMPMFGHFHNAPSFDRLGDLIQALSQLMSGINFMHEHRIAHRDACLLNFVADKTYLVPGGFHFSAQLRAPDGKRWIKNFRTHSSVQVEYYIIDFGLSLIDPQPGDHGRVGQDKTVPEWRRHPPHYDPFKLDIYQFGSMILRDFMESEWEYIGAALSPLRPLATAMTCENPDERLTSEEAARELERLAERFPVGQGPWINSDKVEPRQWRLPLRRLLRLFISCT